MPFENDELTEIVFKNKEIEQLDLSTMEGLGLLLHHLCGVPISLGCKAATGCQTCQNWKVLKEKLKLDEGVVSSIEAATECQKCQRCMNWNVLKERLKLESLTLDDLNDMLVLVDQLPISKAFFRTFFSRDSKVTFAGLKQGVTRFEGFAVFLYGNVRFGYRKLRNLDPVQLSEEMRGYERPLSVVMEKDFEGRRAALPLPCPVNEKLTWLLGYIAKNKADRDITMSAAIGVALGLENEANFLAGKKDAEVKLYRQLSERVAASEEWRQLYSDFDQIKAKVEGLQQAINESRNRGWTNTSHYLALDYMDVYVATSMRERWEFEDVHTTAAAVFSDSSLDPLKLRYFDPTQSFLENRVDKGLVEGLMLKRAKCTIYMAQETDTFGKDSELATTLAQGKPVIAYVPEIDENKHAETAADRPLAYFQKRLPQLLAEELIRSSHVPECLHFLERVASFDPYFVVIGDEEEIFLEREKLVETKRTMAAILAKGEKELFDKRARALQKNHPLALQVHLERGVANGVLVVRSPEKCAMLLRQLLTNSCGFIFDKEHEKEVTCLVERVSKSPFRVVTENSTVTNAFWSRYLVQERGTKRQN